MARIHTNVLHWGNKYDGPNTYKMGREGALEDALWDEDELVDYRRRGKKKTNPHYKGCPGNDGKAHVYVKVVEKGYSWYSNKWYEIERTKCCGCLKIKRSRWIGF